MILFENFFPVSGGEEEERKQKPGQGQSFSEASKQGQKSETPQEKPTSITGTENPESVFGETQKEEEKTDQTINQEGKRGGEEIQKVESEQGAVEGRLNEKRKDYIVAYKEYYSSVVSQIKGEELRELERVISSARILIKGENPEEEKQRFINELNKNLENKGIKLNDEAKLTIYNVEIKKLEYDAEWRQLMGELLKKEGIEKSEIVKRVLYEKELLNKEKVESWPPKEKSLFGKIMDWWKKQGPVKRLLISTAILLPGAFLGSVIGIPGVTAAALISPTRLLRAGVGLLLGHLARTVGGVFERRIQNDTKLQLESIFESVREDLKNNKDLKTALSDLSEKVENVLKEQEKRLGRTKLYTGIAAVAAAMGGALLTGVLARGFDLTSLRLGRIDELSLSKGVDKEVIKEALDKVPGKPQGTFLLEIGRRGPEGAIIDYLKSNREVAKSLGWDGKMNLVEWAGKKAHLLWLEDAEEALKKPEVLEQLKKLGYSPDIEGYAQMMRRIGKGVVEFNPQTGKINLVDMEYLKARVPVEAVPEEIKEVPIKPIEQTPVEFESGEKFFSGETVDISNGVKRAIGFTDGEYNNIKNIPVDKLLAEIPADKDLAWAKFREGTIDLPHDGLYGPNEFEKHFQLAQFIRANLPTNLQGNLTIENYLKYFYQQFTEGNFVDLRKGITKIIGLNEEEYNVIKEVTVEKLLKEIPSREEAWEIFKRGNEIGKSIDLPHHGIYGSEEFGKHVKLAEVIRALNPTSEQLKWTIDNFLKNFSKVVKSLLEEGIEKKGMGPI